MLIKGVGESAVACRVAGSMRQRSSGSWELRVYIGVDPETRRRRYRTKTVRGTRAVGPTRITTSQQEHSMTPPVAGIDPYQIRVELDRLPCPRWHRSKKCLVSGPEGPLIAFSRAAEVTVDAAICHGWGMAGSMRQRSSGRGFRADDETWEGAGDAVR